jgi:hypothetical protein
LYSNQKIEKTQKQLQASNPKKPSFSQLKKKKKIDAGGEARTHDLWVMNPTL